MRKPRLKANKWDCAVDFEAGAGGFDTHQECQEWFDWAQGEMPILKALWKKHGSVKAIEQSQQILSSMVDEEKLVQILVESRRELLRISKKMKAAEYFESTEYRKAQLEFLKHWTIHWMVKDIAPELLAEIEKSVEWSYEELVYIMTVHVAASQEIIATRVITPDHEPHKPPKEKPAPEPEPIVPLPEDLSIVPIYMTHGKLWKYWEHPLFEKFREVSGFSDPYFYYWPINEHCPFVWRGQKEYCDAWTKMYNETPLGDELTSHPISEGYKKLCAEWGFDWAEFVGLDPISASMWMNMSMRKAYGDRKKKEEATLKLADKEREIEEKILEQELTAKIKARRKAELEAANVEEPIKE